MRSFTGFSTLSLSEQVSFQLLAPLSEAQEGEALLLLLDHEEAFLEEIQDVPVTRSPRAAALLNDEGLFTTRALSAAAWAKKSKLNSLAQGAFAALLQHLWRGMALRPIRT